MTRIVNETPWSDPRSYAPDLFDRLRAAPTIRDDARGALRDPFFTFFLGGYCGCLLTVVAAAIWAGVL